MFDIVVRKHSSVVCLIVFTLSISSSHLLTNNNETERRHRNLTSLSDSSKSSLTSALQTTTLTALSTNPSIDIINESNSTNVIMTDEDSEGSELTTTYTTVENKSYFYDQSSNSDTKQEYGENTTQTELSSSPNPLSSTSSEALDPNVFIGIVSNNSNSNSTKLLNQTIESGEKRRTNANPSVDDIISGILQLIGGNVKLSRPPVNKLQPLGPLGPFRPEPTLSGTRINNRGPPKVPLVNPMGHPIANVVPPSVLIGPGRPAGIALPMPPSHMVRFPLPLNIVPTKPPFVIPESDVSFLLGLIKPHIKDDKEMNVLKNLPKLQTSILNDRIKDKSTTNSIINSRPIFTEKILANPSKIQEFIRSNAYYSNIFSSLSSHLMESNESKTSHSTESLIEQNLTNNFENISSFIIPIQTESPLPSGPVTDWVPLLTPSSASTHEYPSDEPIIITMPDEPSVFEMIVKQQIGPKPTITSSAAIDPTPPLTKISDISTQVSKETIDLTANTTTFSSSSILPSITTNSISTTLTNNMSKDEAEIVYGRPAPTTEYKPIAPSFSTNVEEIVTLLGSGELPTNSQFVSTSTKSMIAVGKPIVVPVEMDEVRPQVGHNRPHPNNRIPAGNGDNKVNSKPSASAPTLQVGSGVTVNGDDSNDKKGILQPNGQTSQTKPLIVRRPPFRPRPNVPIVRIDTCIVGDDSTCDSSLNEKCLTELGLSSCQCRPGFSRNQARSPCVPVISLAMSLKVDRIGDKKLLFSRNLLNSDSEDYQYLEYESLQALNSIFSLSKLTRVYLGSKINRFYSVAGKTIVNASINLELNNATVSSSIKRYVQQELSRIIAVRNNNIGESQLWVEGSLNAIPRVEDLNECSNSELNDCSKNAKCINDFGTFRCECESGYEDKFGSDKLKSGRFCSTCSPQYCSNRGECFIVNGERECKCKGNFIGSKCDIDAEVLGVALGGSVAALIIIIITFLCLYMWNQRWKKEQQKMEAMSAASGHTFSYVNKQAATAYRLTIDDRMRWAQIAEAMASNPTYSSNYYVNPEQLSSSQHHLNHVYATPNRVSSSGTLINDDLCGYESRQYSRSLRPKSRTTSTSHGYSKSGGNDSIYNETEFSTREMIYSPTHLIPAPRSQFAYS